jgi:hypothetical protein
MTNGCHGSCYCTLVMIAPIIVEDFNVIESLEDKLRASQQHESTKRSKMHGRNWF